MVKEKRACNSSFFSIAQSPVPGIEPDFPGHVRCLTNLAQRFGYYSMEVSK